MSSSLPPSSPPLDASGRDQVEPPSSPPTFASRRVVLRGRKRAFPAPDDFSSDPLFSDDIIGAEDRTQYERPKQKRMLRGPWWVVSQREPRRKSRADVTFGDSGVFLGSDATVEIGSDDMDAGAPPPPQHHCAVPATPSVLAKRSAESVAREVISECVDAGRETVDLTDLGLTSLSPEMLRPLRHLIKLSHLSGADPPSEEEFRPLTPALKIFLAQNSLSSLPEELFDLENITVLSLRANRLTSVPPAVGKLRKLEELNIAGNQIQVLPWQALPLLCNQSAAFRIRPNPLLQPTDWSEPRADREDRIDTLLSRQRNTVGGKRDKSFRATLKTENNVLTDDVIWKRYKSRMRDLRSAPVLNSEDKVFSMMSCRQMTMASLLQAKLNTDSHYRAGFLAASEVRYFDIDGGPCHGPKDRPRLSDFRSSANTPVTDVLRHKTSPSCATHCNPVPVFDEHPTDEECEPGRQARSVRPGPRSLAELSARCLQKYLYPTQLETISRDAPSNMRPLLEAITHCPPSAREQCSACGRDMIVPRAEWVEYWTMRSCDEYLDEQNVLPFVRKACSWGCAVPSEFPKTLGKEAWTTEAWSTTT